MTTGSKRGRTIATAATCSPCDGDLRPQSGLTRLFHRLVAEHGLPPIRLHDHRHGASMLAFAAEVELKVVQSMLGIPAS